MARPKRTTPWLSRRGDKVNGTFYAFWYDDENRETKRLSLATTDSGEAEIAFAEFLLNGREIRQARPKGGLSVAQALDDYLAEHVAEHVADGTRQKDAAKHLKEFFGDRLLTDVDVPLSRDYAAARFSGKIGGGKRRKKTEEKVAKPATVRRELNVLTAAANHAKWMKRTDPNFQVSVDLPPEKRLGQDDEAPYYTQEELDQIFAAAREIAAEERAKNPSDPRAGEIEQFVLLLYYTGARRRSIEDLGRSQVKMPQKRILLQKPGKRATKKRQPIVPIFKAMEDPLNQLLTMSDGERLFRCADFYRPYKALCKRAGIDVKKEKETAKNEGDTLETKTVEEKEDEAKKEKEKSRRWHPHIMRHTRATHLLQSGKSIYDVARLLGDTIATVERVYGHHSADHLANRLEV